MAEQNKETPVNVTVESSNWGRNLFYLILSSMLISTMYDFECNSAKDTKKFYQTVKSITAEPPKKDTVVVILKSEDGTKPKTVPVPR